jgi:outer membrane immunogenic protein
MKFASIVGFSLLTATSVHAADLGARAYAKAPPIDPVFSWTGFYLGVNAGSGWGRTNTDELCFDCSPSPVFPLGKHSYSGFIGGGQIGFNYQFGNLVLGVESDFDATDIHGASTAGPDDYTNTTRYNWIASVRGRGGWAINNFYLYATGGAAFADVRHSSLDFSTGAPEASTTKTGSVVGGGLEYAIGNHWSIRGEYLYYDIGSNRLQINLVPIRPVYFQFTDHVQSGRAGINYKF